MAHTRAFNLEPGRAFGPFELGALLWDVLTTLRSAQNAFPNVEISWSSSNPASGPIMLSLTQPPLKLLFSGPSQRLALIELANPLPSAGPRIIANSRGRSNSATGTAASNREVADWIVYKGQPLSVSATEFDRKVTPKVLHRIFGPTYPSTPHKTFSDERVLSYPGVAFSLSDAHGLVRLIVSQSVGGADGEAYVLEGEGQVGETDGMDGDIKEANIQLPAPHDDQYSPSVLFKFHSLATSSSRSSASPSSSKAAIPDVKVTIGQTTAEDLSVEFGAAQRVFWKEDDRMKIHAHASSPGSSASSDPNPYFMSYFNLGVDFLLDPVSHRVVKIVLHSNIPGEVGFGRYGRSGWVIEGGKAETGRAWDEKASSIIARLNARASSTLTAPSTTSHLHPSPSASSASPSPSPPPLPTTTSNATSSRKPKKGSSSTSPNLVPADVPAFAAAPEVKVTSPGVQGKPKTGKTTVELPMELDRTADAADEGLTLQRRTQLVGFKGIVLEVTESDEVETIWLF